MVQSGVLFYSKAGQKSRFWRRPWFRRLALFALLAAVVFRWGPDAYHAYRIHYWQRACLNYQAPQDRVVFDTTGQSLAAQMPSTEGRRLYTSALGTSVGHVPPSLTAFAQISGLNTAGAGTRLAEPVLFMHERYSASGNRRLVVVTMDCVEAGSSGVAHAIVIRPGSIGATPVILSTTSTYDADADFVTGNFAPFRGGSGERYFDGQADSTDRSHFTIPYLFGDIPMAIEGWLMDDESLRLVIHSRSSPAQAPSER